MIKIGIECENLEDKKSRYGVGRIVLNLLQEYANDTELQKEYELYLYFKLKVPDDEFLRNPIFKKRVLGFPSFNIFYHILMPLRAIFDGLDWMFFPAYQLPPLYIGKSIVMLTEDVYYEYKYGDLPFRYKLSYRIFTNWAAKFATKILAISETSKNELVKLYKINPTRIFVNYLGIDTLPSFAQGFEGQQKEDNYLLFVGQMFPRRHAKETILAFEELIINHSQILENLRMVNLKLIMVGSDKYPGLTIDPLVEHGNKKLGREVIIHKDYVNNNELAKLYANARALVYVSDREAFGLPPIEALSFGVPSIVMDNELGHELFGELAVYAKSGSIEDILEAVKRVLNKSDLSTMIKANRFEFAKKYNWKSFADRFFEIIK